MTAVTIEGRLVQSEADLHRMLAAQLDFGPYYGKNRAASRDRLLTDVPRPVHLVWKDSSVSRRAIGDEAFAKIVGIFTEAVEQDASFGWEDRFEFELA